MRMAEKIGSLRSLFAQLSRDFPAADLLSLHLYLGNQKIVSVVKKTNINKLVDFPSPSC